MDATNLHITEYRGEQVIDFFGITSFKVQNHGEAVVEINTIPIYPGKTVKIIEEDSTQCDFRMTAKFTEEGKIPKFRAIYKQFGNADCYDHLHQQVPYAATLYNYEQGDVVEFSQNISGHTILTRSFDGGVTFLPENDIDLGFIEANQAVKYDLGGSLETNAIQFRNDDLAANSEIFVVGAVIEPIVATLYEADASPYLNIDYYPPLFNVDFDGEVLLRYKKLLKYELGVPIYENGFTTVSLGIGVANVNRALVVPPHPYVDSMLWYRFQNAITGALSQLFPIFDATK